MLSIALTATSAQAAITFAFSVSGNDVVLTVSGALDLTGLTETTISASLGATPLMSTNRLQVGSGSNAAVNAWNMTLQNDAIDANPTVNPTIDFWQSGAGYSNSIRFEEDNNRMLIDDAFQPGDTLNVAATHTFANVTLADLGLTAGQNTLWFRNTNVVGDAGNVYVTAIPEPSVTVLLGGLALFALVRRRPGVTR